METMPMPLHSTLKRSQTCLDLISMNHTDSNEYRGFEPFPIEALKKRSAAYSFGWDHYRSDEDFKASYEHQGWRNQKRSRKQDYSPQMISTTRVKLPRHRGISSVREDEPRPRQMACTPKPSCGEYQSIYGTSPNDIEEDISDVSEEVRHIIQDFAKAEIISRVN